MYAARRTGVKQEMFGYVGDLRSKTQGRAVYSMQFDSYSEVPKAVADEIIHNAISAGTEDPRFDEVQKSELDSLVYSVDVLGVPEKIRSKDSLDARKYGVIVKNGMRHGLLLPNLDGVDTPEQQINIALQKAGISPHEEYTLERFEVVRHK